MSDSIPAPAVCPCGAVATLLGVHGVFCSTEHARCAWMGEELAPASEDDDADAAQYVHVADVNLLTTPLSREDKGRASWTAMHALVGALEDDETTRALAPQDLSDVRAYIGVLARLYPCEQCRVHFAAMVERSPPTFTTARGAQLWVAERHNDVNRRLGKREWPTDGPTPDEQARAASVGSECRR